MGRILSRRLFRTGTCVASLEGIYTRHTPSTVQTRCIKFAIRVRTRSRCHNRPGKTPGQTQQARNAGCQRWVPEDRSTRAVLCDCGTQPRTRIDRRHSRATSYTQKHNFFAIGPCEAGGARRPTKGTQPLAHTDRRRSGHSEAKLRRRPSIQVGCHELRPRAAELVHKGGRVDGELLHDAHKLRVETERQVAREHVKLLTHRLVL